MQKKEKVKKVKKEIQKGKLRAEIRVKTLKCKKEKSVLKIEGVIREKNHR